MLVACVALVVVFASCAREETPLVGPSAAPATATPSPSPTPTAAPPVVTVQRTTAPSVSVAPGGPAFSGRASRLSAAQRTRMTGSTWRTGCPVGLDDLRLLEMSHWDTTGKVKRGVMVVHADAADAVLSAFRKVFEARYTITRMRLMESYGGDDRRSMEDDNTSAFNCRRVAGSSSWSQHAFGRAVDVNPFENPWVKGSEVDPPGASGYADRSRRDPRMIRQGDAVWNAFRGVGWEWGGDWSSPKDYQHFSANGR